MSNINIAWWNLENLFDHEGARRSAELAAVLKSEVKGWTVAIRNRKIDQLARAIKAMFNGTGPDLIGVAEAENNAVLRLLAARLTIPGRKYKVVSHASPDARGIDVSFLYDQNTLAPSKPAITWLPSVAPPAICSGRRSKWSALRPRSWRSATTGRPAAAVFMKANRSG
jgi:hypothetical protein